MMVSLAQNIFIKSFRQAYLNKYFRENITETKTILKIIEL